ncbi:MAG TPA: helix-turn-helix transcriptional regulator [Lacipirellulaceae bacterium]|jgi:hypothetical protein
MLALSLALEIERLLTEGKLSQRKIAKRLGVGRGTVAAIANGRRGIYGHDEESDGHDPHVHLSPPERCAVCGYLVYMPCLVCRAREHQHWQNVWQSNGSAGRLSVDREPQRMKARIRRRCRNRPVRSALVA